MPVTAGAYQPAIGGGGDAFFLKLSADGARLLYGTFLGGSADEQEGGGVALDADGNVYVSGVTKSVDFPVTAGAYQTVYGGDRDDFVAKFDARNRIVYATYLGASANEREGGGIAADASGDAYIAGSTTSADFPVTPGAFQTAIAGKSDLWLAKLNPTGSAIVWATFLGGRSEDYSFGIALAPDGGVWATGITSSPDFPVTPDAHQVVWGGDWDLYVVRVTATAGAVTYATYLGGSGDDGKLSGADVDMGKGVAAGPDGAAYVTCGTASMDFPVTLGSFGPAAVGGTDAIVAKIRP
jgi:hypothetical protein